MNLQYFQYDNQITCTLYVHVFPPLCFIRGIKIPPRPSLAWPLSLILCRIIFLFLWEHCMLFLSQLKYQHPTFQQSNNFIDIGCNHVPGFMLPRQTLHTEKHHTFTECNTNSEAIHCLNTEWCRLETRVPLHSFQPSCIFAPHPETCNLVLCFIIRASSAACCAW